MNDAIVQAVLTAVGGTPLALVLIWLLISEKRSGEAMRASHDAERRDWWTQSSAQSKQYAESIERMAQSIDKQTEAIDRLRESQNNRSN